MTGLSESPFANILYAKDIQIHFPSENDINQYIRKEKRKRHFLRYINVPPLTQRSFDLCEINKKNTSQKYSSVAGLLFNSCVKKVTWYDGKYE